MCRGSWHGPHAFDIELEKLVDLMLRVRAQGYLIEAANARHEHEYALWEHVKLPAGKILIPGMISHATDGTRMSRKSGYRFSDKDMRAKSRNQKRPALVAQRIRRFARRVGPENVIAGADCGFGGRSFGNDWTVFFTRPISGAVMALVIVTLLVPIFGAFRAKRS